VSAYKFTNAAGVSKFGRYRVVPQDGNEYLDSSAAEKKSPNFLFDDVKDRIARSASRADTAAAQPPYSGNQKVSPRCNNLSAKSPSVDQEREGPRLLVPHKGDVISDTLIDVPLDAVFTGLESDCPRARVQSANPPALDDGGLRN
jgi:hypothetical protein